MSKSLTDEQLAKSLDLLTRCAKNKWHFSIQEKIANIIAMSENKDLTITQIEKILQTENEQQVITMLDTL